MTLTQATLELAEKMRRSRQLNLLPSWLTDRECELAELALREAALRLNAEVTERMT